MNEWMNKKKQLNELLQSEIKQKLSAVKKITWITAIADKKIISIFCVPGNCTPHLTPAVQSKWFL